MRIPCGIFTHCKFDNFLTKVSFAYLGEFTLLDLERRADLGSSWLFICNSSFFSAKTLLDFLGFINKYSACRTAIFMKFQQSQLELRTCSKSFEKFSKVFHLSIPSFSICTKVAEIGRQLHKIHKHENKKGLTKTKYGDGE